MQTRVLGSLLGVAGLVGLGVLVTACSSGPPAAAVPTAASGAATASPGAKAPGAAGDGLTPAQVKRSCECAIWDLERAGGEKLSSAERENTCKQDEPNVDCVLTFGSLSDCQALVECSRGEPGRMPSCRDGYQLYAMNVCHKKCDADPKGCPPKTACDPDEKLCKPSG